MIRVILHPSGEVRALPQDTLCTWAPKAMDGTVGVGVEARRLIALRAVPRARFQIRERALGGATTASALFTGL